jgi:hypothetical protein
MKRMKKLIGIMLLALVASLGTPQAFAGPGEVAGQPLAGPTQVSGETADGPGELPGVMVIILDYLAVMI